MKLYLARERQRHALGDRACRGQSRRSARLKLRARAVEGRQRVREARPYAGAFPAAQLVRHLRVEAHDVLLRGRQRLGRVLSWLLRSPRQRWRSRRNVAPVSPVARLARRQLLRMHAKRVDTGRRKARLCRQGVMHVCGRCFEGHVRESYPPPL